MIWIELWSVNCLIRIENILQAEQTFPDNIRQIDGTFSPVRFYLPHNDNGLTVVFAAGINDNSVTKRLIGSFFSGYRIADLQRIFLQVHIIPFQRKNFPKPHSTIQRNNNAKRLYFWSNHYAVFQTLLLVYA